MRTRRGFRRRPREVLELENPLSEEASVMRTSLAPGMLDMLAWNLNRDVPEARLVRNGQRVRIVGQASASSRGAPVWARRAAVARSSLPAGGALDVSKGEQAEAAETFRGFKGDVESLLAAFAGEVTLRSGDRGVFSSRAFGAGAA